MPEILVVQAEIAELTRVDNWVDAHVKSWDLPESTSYAIHLCFEEAISNVILHGFSGRHGEPELNKDVRLTLERENGTVTIAIEDHGVAFDPLKVAAPAVPTTISEAKIGGLGIHLMRKFAQHLAYERRGGTNCLTLRFDLTQTGE